MVTALLLRQWRCRDDWLLQLQLSVVCRKERMMIHLLDIFTLEFNAVSKNDFVSAVYLVCWPYLMPFFSLFHILNAVIELVRAWCNLFFLSTLPAAHSTVSSSLKGMVFTSLNKGKGNYLLMVRFSKCLNWEIYVYICDSMLRSWKNM